MHTLFDAQVQNFDVATPVRRGLVFRDQSRPTRIGPKRSLILGVYAYTLCRRTTKFDVYVDTCGEERVSWVSPASRPKRAELTYGSPVIGVL